MKRFDNISIPILEDSCERLKKECARRMGVRGDIGEMRILRRSIDARHKDRIIAVYTVECAAPGERLPKPETYKTMRLPKEPDISPVVVGSGPAGMLCALTLAEAGARPVILERGGSVDERVQAVERYCSGESLDTESNIQFGEGGAGTFSDGKLNTGIRDVRIARVFRVFIEAGAPEDIAWQAKPHIGTDILRTMVRNIRKRIEALGGTYCFNTKLVDIEEKGGQVAAVRVISNGEEREIPCERLVLATGHSARDTFEMLERHGVALQQKAFSMGARIEHPQTLVDRAQYGAFAGKIGAADYKLAAKARDGRGVYTFCMCPGGNVVAAASEPETVVTNGMSLRARDGRYANSAVLVSVNPSDFPDSSPLAGMYMQREVERAAYKTVRSLSPESPAACAPAQLLGDLMAGRSSVGKKIETTYRTGVVGGDLSGFLPEFVVRGIADGCAQFDRRLRGFASPDAVLIAPETRSSSPVRILRDDTFQSSLRGMYPCGEGAGYAGGITSAAVDGIKCAEQVLEALSE